MRVTKYSIVVIVSVAVLLIIGLVGYNIHSRFQPCDHLAEDGEKMNREKVEVIATYGKIPEFENEEQRRDWLDNLDEIGKSVRSEMRPYFYPEGPVVVFGNHYDGYMRMSLKKDMVIDEKTLMDEIYVIIDKQAREMGIQDVPVVFELTTSLYVPHEESQLSRENEVKKV